MRAAVLRSSGARAVELRDDVTALGPDAGEVRIRVRASGVCHSDLSLVTGELPGGGGAMVVGHEAAGEVVAVGEGARAVEPGDHVVVNWIPSCGMCRDCRDGKPYLCMAFMGNLFDRPRFRCGDTPAFGMAGTGTWAEELVVPWQAAIKIDRDVPFEHAALLGCAVPAGVGAVFNTARPRPGGAVAVVGLGGVGLSAVQAARIAGATTIVAVDPLESKHALATRFGATHTVVPDALEGVKDRLTGGVGFDCVYEAVGRAATVKLAWQHTRRGGDVVVVGAGAPDDNLQISTYELLFAARDLRPSIYGSGDLRRDLPALVELYRAGRFDIEGLITRRIRFEELNEALTALEKGEAVRQVMTFE